ncbi:MAG: fibronectin type III domain-containing protein [Pseudobdellovibrio sp.]
MLSRKQILLRSITLTSTTLTLSLTLFSGCKSKVSLTSENLTQINSGLAQAKLGVNVNKYASNKLICNPFGDGPTTQTNYEKGIKAELFYRTLAMPRLYSSVDYVQFAQKSDQSIFLSDMNVPTRMFTEGFANASGSYLKNDSGEKLIEYFGLKMTTNLVLSDNDPDGEYELALLSDDGTTLTLKSGTDISADDKLIANDGDHPTRMGCSTHTITMRRNVMVPIEVTFYQGPRYHIANVLMWRKSSEAGKDSLCGQLGNNLFYNPDANSAPQQAVKDLLSRGWSVLIPDNFMVSSTKVDYNPCVKGTDPIISNFAIGEVVLTQVNFTWQTDIPATAQIQLTNMTTGQVTITDSDNILRTNNTIVISNLQPQTTYKAQAISVSADLGRSLSSELSFMTQ